jgi:hypothetical protein
MNSLWARISILAFLAIGLFTLTARADPPQPDNFFGNYNASLVYQGHRTNCNIRFYGDGNVDGICSTKAPPGIPCVEGVIGTNTIPVTYQWEYGFLHVPYDGMELFVFQQGGNCATTRAGFLDVFFDGNNLIDCDPLGNGRYVCNEDLEVTPPSAAYDKRYGKKLGNVNGTIIFPDGD